MTFAAAVLAATFANPVLPADFSDIDCVRSGDRFYAITSTLHCSPGMDVLQSSNMVDWQVVGHVVEDTSVFGEDWTWKRMRRYGHGVWAGCIRERKGLFYCYFGTPDEGIFVAVPYEICGEGPQIKAAVPLQAQGFNEGRIPRPVKDDVRYMKSRDGRCVYAIELAPDGQAPRCPALEAKGLKLAKTLEAMPGFPAVYVFE